MVLSRHDLTAAVQIALSRSPVVLLAGPRQCGKTTLARQFVAPTSVSYFDLEDPLGLSRLSEPMTALSSLSGLIVIDEVQRRPDIFPVLRVLVDRDDNRARFLILGSAAGDLLRQSSESLAGRLEWVTMGGFTLREAGADAASSLWLRGGFPRAFLARDEPTSLAWRASFVQTLLERDFPQWGVRTSAIALRRFWTMVAHYHGQTWKATDPARALDVSEPAARRYLDLLTDGYMVRQLQPFHANLRKRQVKAPKVYVRDSGLLHQLLGVASMQELLAHPKAGASWEGFAVEQVLATEPHDDAYFWATHQGAEMDLVLRRGSTLVGVECKRTDTPRVTPSIRIALDDLGLERVVVLYPGEKRFPLTDRVEAVPLVDLAAGTPLFSG
ncbi:MAG: ATP-binding protein [Acidobacteria bacterium]|nr:ATP-binding protein [Acidobacteriota bacterium]